MALTPGAVAYVVTSLGPPGGTTVADWVATSREESSHRHDVVNSIGAVGLWQVRDIHAGKGGGPTNRNAYREWLKVPGNNFRAAKAVYAEQGWRAWEVWEDTGWQPRPNSADRAAAANPDALALARGVGTSQAGVSDLLGDPGAAADLLTDVIPNPIDDVAAAILNAFKAVVEFANRVGKWVTDRDNWIRIAEVIGGVGLGYVAVSVVAKPVVDSAVKDVSKVIPAGKIAKVVGK